MSALCSMSARPSSLEDLERRQRAGEERRRARRGPRGACAWRGRRRPPLAPSAGGVVASAVLPARRPSRRPASTPAALVARVGRRRRRRPAPLGGSVTTAARASANGAVGAGSAIASTKCSWKRGSTAVSIFSTRRTTPSISRRAARDSSAISAPVPAALPADADVLEVAVGDRGRAPSRGRDRSGCRTRRPAGSVDGLDRRGGPSAAGRRRRARPWRAGSRGRRSG